MASDTLRGSRKRAFARLASHIMRKVPFFFRTKKMPTFSLGWRVHLSRPRAARFLTKAPYCRPPCSKAGSTYMLGMPTSFTCAAYSASVLKMCSRNRPNISASSPLRTSWMLGALGARHGSDTSLLPNGAMFPVLSLL